MAFAGPPIEAILLTVVVAFLPSVVYLIALRYAEKYDREPWGSLFTAFLFGATGAVILVILLRQMFIDIFESNRPETLPLEKMLYANFWAVVIITPLAAEIVKPLGLYFVRFELREAEDGLIYGAAIGLGFAATENLLYGIFIMNNYGIDVLIDNIVMRSLSVTLVMACTTALTCYGISRAVASKHRTGRLYAFPLFFLAAVGMHGFINFIAEGGEQFQAVFGLEPSYKYSLIFAIVFSVMFMIIIYFKIHRLDRLDETHSAWETAGQAPPKREAPVRQATSRASPPPRRQAPPPRQQAPPPRSAPPQRSFAHPPPPGRSRPPPSQQPPPPKRRAPPPDEWDDDDWEDDLDDSIDGVDEEWD